MPGSRTRRVAVIGLALLLLAAGCSGVTPEPATPTATVSPASTGPPATPTATAGTGTPTHVPGGTVPPTPTQMPPSGATSTPTTPTTTTGSPGSRGSVSVTVTRVVDGDTLRIRYANGSEDTVRLLGVDTPEIHSEPTPDEWEGVPNIEAGTDCLRAAGHIASDYVTRHLSGETVRLGFDDNEGRRGYYGLLLAYVYHDGEHFNYQLVAQGHARVYDSAFEKREQFYAAEADAQAREVGAWDCRTVEETTATPTATGASSDGGGLAVASVHADAEGNDHENENDEYVVFENTGETALDLSGWTVSDEADHRYTIPQGFTLDAGDRVTLFTGSGSNTDDDLYWGSDSAIWNNGGDTVSVRDDEGAIRVEYSYSG